MYQLTYTLKTLSPVIIAKNSGDPNMVATEDFITGSSILGALSDLYIKQRKLGRDAHLDETFCKCFLQGHLIFTNAYICPDKDTSRTYIPTPLSIQRQKGDTGQTTCYDLLFKTPEQKTSYLGGFCNISNTLIYSAEVKKTINFHHERNYESGSTKEGIIFNYEALSEGQIFKGMILSIEKSYLQNILNLTGNMIELKIGKSRSVQYGSIRMDFDNVQDFKQNNTDIDPEEFSLTFTSPAILLNQHGFCSTDIETLKQSLGEGVDIIKAFLKADEHEGFSSIWGLKKPSQSCISAGSCLLIKATDEALKRLKTLQFSGIGQRTNEGFGRFVLGLQTKSNLNISTNHNEVKKPSEKIPSEVKAICTSLIKERIKKQLEIAALNNANEFSKNNPPTKSLISRIEAMVRKTGLLRLNLRPLAMNKLENCHNGSITLKEYIEKFKIEDLSEHLQLPDSFISEISYDPLADDSFKNEIYREYWLRFFASMRKDLKAKKGGES